MPVEWQQTISNFIFIAFGKILVEFLKIEFEHRKLWGLIEKIMGFTVNKWMTIFFIFKINIRQSNNKNAIFFFYSHLCLLICSITLTSLIVNILRLCFFGSWLCHLLYFGLDPQFPCSRKVVAKISSVSVVVATCFALSEKQRLEVLCW